MCYDLTIAVSNILYGTDVNTRNDVLGECWVIHRLILHCCFFVWESLTKVHNPWCICCCFTQLLLRQREITEANKETRIVRLTFLVYTLLFENVKQQHYSRSILTVHEWVFPILVMWIITEFYLRLQSHIMWGYNLTSWPL